MDCSGCPRCGGDPCAICESPELCKQEGCGSAEWKRTHGVNVGVPTEDCGTCVHFDKGGGQEPCSSCSLLWRDEKQSQWMPADGVVVGDGQTFPRQVLPPESKP